MPGIGISIDSNQISSVSNQYSISTIIANFGIRTLTTLKNLLNITLYSTDCHINVPKYQYRYRNIGISIQILGIGIDSNQISSIGIDSNQISGIGIDSNQISGIGIGSNQISGIGIGSNFGIGTSLH